jgi:hypothetical protein
MTREWSSTVIQSCDAFLPMLLRAASHSTFFCRAIISTWVTSVCNGPVPVLAFLHGCVSRWFWLMLFRIRESLLRSRRLGPPCHAALWCSFRFQVQW